MTKDITGAKQGQLTAIRFVGRDKRGNAMWLCRCACSDGTEIEVRMSDFISGHVRSCGCSRVTHGAHTRNARTPTYVSWQAMVTRCTNPNRSKWKNYGGAGVTVCERWLDFRNFLADMGERPDGTTLGRFGDVGNYEPGNCAWQTPKQQSAEKIIHHRRHPRVHAAVSAHAARSSKQKEPKRAWRYK
jgi:hypothetical protein